jgi:hypothetical protein
MTAGRHVGLAVAAVIAMLLTLAAAPAGVALAAASGRSRAGMILISLRRFEGLLRPGAVLEIRVTKSGQIGKFTRFTVRRHKLPTRVDSCLSAAGVKPIACPSS